MDTMLGYCPECGGEIWWIQSLQYAICDNCEEEIGSDWL